MLLTAGEFKVVSTKSIEIDATLLEKTILQTNSKINNYFNQELITSFLTGSIDKRLIYYSVENVFNEFNSPSDYFRELELQKMNSDLLIELSEKAERVNKFIYIKFRVEKEIEVEFALFLAYCIAELSEGVINSIGVNYYDWMKEKTHSRMDWITLCKKHIFH